VLRVLFLVLLDLSDVEFLDDSSTESLLLSGDEYNQDFDSTNFEESQDEDDALKEIVRCICEMDEENGFMIQVVGRLLFHAVLDYFRCSTGAYEGMLFLQDKGSALSFY
jgi:hypothetical protein